ncbi:DUF2062 domain-containing protein [Gemmobacter denitrificans]|uniref:DUF2062 domain-containing protein n=1 Tax=Gemmobacter denitrificans TaxID=3123040 RepID=A0ABU8BRL0_9RHOB
MVFKRRDPRSWAQSIREFVYPSGGIRRAVQYVLHRMRRLPDQPHRIARGIFAGTFVNFPPVYGWQMLAAAGLAWIMRGNIIAALLATFISNPLTTPFMAMLCLKLGHWMLGIEAPMTFMSVYLAFTEAGWQLWHNLRSAFTDDVAQWDKLNEFFWFIYWPYTVGSIIPGLITSLFTYYLSLPLIHAYQKLRSARLKEKMEKRRALKARALTGKLAADTGEEDGPGAS